MGSDIGKIVFLDLTIENADVVRDFYQQVVGWTPESVGMGDYADYQMKTLSGDIAAGICHKRGPNQQQPPQWMIYITVADLDQSLAACTAHGGKILVPTREAGSSRFAVIEDPAGAVCTLYEQGAE